MHQEGCEQDNGVNFVYDLWVSVWFALLELRVHRFFLEKAVEIYSKEFEVGGHVWQLRLIHKEDGSLGAYVYSRTADAPPVRFSFTAVNHNDSKDNKHWGDVRAIKNGDCWGFKKLVEIATIKDRSSGFLSGDVFTVKLDLRLKVPENETQRFHRDTNNRGVFTWRLKEVHNMSPWVYVSDEFTLADTKWQLQFYPRGQKHGLDHASIFLYSHNERAVKIKFEASCQNDVLSSETIKRTLEYTYQDTNEGRGWFKFVENKALQDTAFGFLKDGWLTLVANVIVEVEERVQVRQVAGNEPLCVFCLGKPQTSGVLHGETTHRCYCADCARFLKGRREDLNCPICGERVERIIERFY